MDTFKEFIVKKELTASEKTNRIFIMICGIALGFFFVLFTLGTTLIMIGILFAGLSVYFAYQLVTRFFVEYEYILTNSDLDIDKITNQSSRKRLCTVDLHKSSEIGLYASDTEAADGETVILASANNPELNDYYIRATHKTLGKIFVVFTPSSELIEIMKPFLPRNIKNRLS